MEITQHRAQWGEHTQFYLACGPTDGPLLVFVHGWPELSLSWRHQLPALAALGFYCVAPDMRGYGQTTMYSEHSDYAMEAVVDDMVQLLSALGREQAVWVGHDWGSVVVWSLAAHHPEICTGLASLCVPYRTLDAGLEQTLELVNRDIYPADQFPAGQWEYVRYSEENFETATAAFELDPYRVAKLLFRKGDPAGFGQISGTAMVRKNGGWFAGDELPDVPRDADVLTEHDLQTYADGLQRNGFFGASSYYVNNEANAAYSQHSQNDGRLDMPVLFIAAQYDYTCETISSDLAQPMREHCTNLSEALVYSGHWMAQERPLEVNAALTHWLVTALPELWPSSRPE